MTEPVSRLCSAVLITSLALGLPVQSFAAPAESPTAEGPSPATSSTEVPDAAAIRSALDDGDLTTARELAIVLADAEPNSDNLALEAEVWLALGNYEQAIRSLDRAIAALPADTTASEDLGGLEQRRDAIAELARGTQADEPESTHREQLDRARADRIAALTPKPELVPEPVDEPKPREPIIKKWYFWVTLGAIAATAGAIVGVAVAGSVDERSTDAASRQPSPPGGLTIQF
jgi:tetratricopeptide (TPR) repeat protein